MYILNFIISKELRPAKSKKLSQTVVLIVAFICSYCSAIKPGGSLQDVSFSVFPYVVEKNGAYYLRYQRKIQPGESPLLRVVYSKSKNNKAYYFFSVPISHPESGNVIQRPLEDDGFIELAKQGAVYWLNKDGSEVKLNIVKE